MDSRLFRISVRVIFGASDIDKISVINVLILVHVEKAFLPIDSNLAVHFALMLDELRWVRLLRWMLSTGRLLAVHEELQDLILLNQS